MFGLDQLLLQYLGGNYTLLMMAGLILLITINAVVTVWLEAKKKDLHWDDLANFVKEIILYILFLVSMEALVFAAKDIQLLKSLFTGIEVLGFAAILVKYFRGVYQKLKELGMPVDEKIDAALEERLNESADEAKTKTEGEKLE